MKRKSQKAKSQNPTQNQIIPVMPRNYYERMRNIQYNLFALNDPKAHLLKEYLDYGYKQTLGIPVLSTDDQYDVFIGYSGETLLPGQRRSFLAPNREDTGLSFTQRIAERERDTHFVQKLYGRKLGINEKTHDFNHGFIIQSLYFAWADCSWRLHGIVKPEFTLSHYQINLWVKRVLLQQYQVHLVSHP